MSIKIIDELTETEIPMETGLFPDKTRFIRVANMISTRAHIAINWKYEDDSELSTLLFVTRHLQQVPDIKLKLIMYYIPYARFDRVNNPDEVFTLKYFADFINSLKFDELVVLDAHSNVSLALFNRLSVLKPNNFIQKAIDQSKPTILFMPDEGAHKRYASAFPKLPSTFGIKHRDWRTGKITDYEIAEPSMVTNANVLIVDDICSKGGTFYFAAKSLKKAGAKNVDLYVTHCEENIKNGKLFEAESPINQIYTANPLYSINPYTIKLRSIKVVSDFK